MARYTHQDQYTITGINTEFEKIEQAFKDMLSRVGDSGNALADDVDANGVRILNLPEPVNNSEPLTLGRGRGILDDATAEANRALAQANRAEQEADAAEQSATTAANAAQTAADDAADLAVQEAETRLSGYVTDTEDNAQAASQSEAQAEVFKNQAGQSVSSAAGFAQQADSSAEQLSGFIDDYASTGLMFPLDLGFVGNEITNSFDLGELP